MKTSVQLTLGSRRKKRGSGTIRTVSLHIVGTQEVRAEALSKVIGSLVDLAPRWFKKTDLGTKGGGTGRSDQGSCK